MMPPDALVFAEVAARRRVGKSRRDPYQTPRKRALSAEQEVAIRASSGNRTLRELAAEFGVSDETVQAVCRRDNRAT